MVEPAGSLVAAAAAAAAGQLITQTQAPVSALVGLEVSAETPASSWTHSSRR